MYPEQQTDDIVQFGNANLANCCLHLMGYVSRHEKQLAKGPKSPTSLPSPPGSPLSSPGSSPRSWTSSSPRKARKMRFKTPLPWPWPSVLSTFNLVRKHGKDTITWQDLTMAKLEMEAAAMADRIARSDLSRDFVYELVSRCEKSSGYMDHAQSMFAACAEIHSPAKALEQQPVVNPSLDLTPDALAITIPGEAPPVALNFQEFKAFVEILAPQSEVPTMLELHVLMARDMLCCGKPSRSTFNKYIACMIWKFHQFLKLSLGVWDRDVIESYRIRDRVEAYSADPDASDEDLSGLCLDMMSCLGQTYTLVYQFSPWTVVMSKLSEALNATPLTVTTELSSKSCLRREVNEQGLETVVAGTAYPKLPPVFPPFRANQTSAQWLSEFASCRLCQFTVNMLRFFATLGLVSMPMRLWVPAYFLASLPFRALSVFYDVVGGQ